MITALRTWKLGEQILTSSTGYALDCTVLLDGPSSISALCLWVYIAPVGLELAVNLRMT